MLAHVLLIMLVINVIIMLLFIICSSTAYPLGIGGITAFEVLHEFSCERPVDTLQAFQYGTS